MSILDYSIRNSKIFLKGTTFSKLNNNNGKDSNILTYIAIFGKYEEAYIGKIIQIKLKKKLFMKQNSKEKNLYLVDAS